MADEQTTDTEGQGAGEDAGQTADAREQGGRGTLMTRGLEADDDKGGDDQGGGKDADKSKGGDKKDDPADAVPDKPEGYALAFAEGVQVDRELLAGFQKAAHELGLPPSKAQKLADMYVAHQGKAVENIVQAHVQAHQKAIDDATARWEGEIESRPNFARESEDIKAALRKFGDKEVYRLINQTNLGSHPKMWAFMANVGRALAEPGFHGRNSNKAKTAAEALYPNQGKQ